MKYSLVNSLQSKLASKALGNKEDTFKGEVPYWVLKEVRYVVNSAEFWLF